MAVLASAEAQRIQRVRGELTQVMFGIRRPCVTTHSQCSQYQWFYLTHSRRSRVARAGAVRMGEIRDFLFITIVASLLASLPYGGFEGAEICSPTLKLPTAVRSPTVGSAASVSQAGPRAPDRLHLPAPPTRCTRGAPQQTTSTSASGLALSLTTDCRFPLRRPCLSQLALDHIRQSLPLWTRRSVL